MESPARRLMRHLLQHVMLYGVTVLGTLLDRVLSMGESPCKQAFCNSSIITMTVTLTRLDILYATITSLNQIHTNLF